jgi:hypothetical protein
MKRERLAKLITNILNPFLISLVIIILLAYQATSRTADFFKWAAVAMALSVVPSFIIALFLVRKNKLDSFFSNPREQRYIIYLSATFLAALGCGLLWYFKAPQLMLNTFIAGLVSVVIFTGINYFWKISLHTAFVAASTALIIIVYGAAAAWTCVFLPPVAWARVELKQHSLAQVVTGGLLAAAIVVGVFTGLGSAGS